MLAVAAFADINVKGTVIDADTSEPMIGVSILVKGTSTGTVTDFDGNFELTVPDKATLQLSYMGYKSIEVRAVSNMNIIMESDALQLQEVVSLGYSAVKKAELSSAVVTVSAEELTDVTTSDIGNMLQGKVPAAVRILTVLCCYSHQDPRRYTVHRTSRPRFRPCTAPPYQMTSLSSRVSVVGLAPSIFWAHNLDR